MEEAAHSQTSDAEVPYRYLPLDAIPEAKLIRIIRLLPSPCLSAPLECEIVNHTLGFPSSFAYEAVSYVWGDPYITVPLTLNGRAHSVTTNLGPALRYLRLENEKRVLWVDALCINQSNFGEKNGQVAIMREIYLKAEKVLV